MNDTKETTEAALHRIAKENVRLSSEGAVMREALKEIAKGEGRYDMDQLKHASNTIEDMVHLANNALATLTQMEPVSEGRGSE